MSRTVSAISRKTGAAAWWGVAALYALMIFGLSSQSHPLGADHWPLGSDKLAHALLYGGFSIVLGIALRRSWPGASFGRLSVIAAGLAVLYGVSDEWHQSFVPFREMDGADLVADAVGAGLAQWALWRLARRGSRSGNRLINASASR